MLLAMFNMGHLKKECDIPSANVKVHLECIEKEKNIQQLWLFAPGVSNHVELSGGNPWCLCELKSSSSQPPGVIVSWGQTEAATPVGMGNRHVPRRRMLGTRKGHGAELA